MVWMRIPRELTWCQHGLLDFYGDYPEPQIESENGLAEGLKQMQAVFSSREWRQESALADIKRQRILYDEEQRFVRYAMALLLKPHEFFQRQLYSREAYIHACLVKVLVEQNIYNYSPFLLQSNTGHMTTSLISSQDYNEIMLQIQRHGFRDEELTGMITEYFGQIEESMLSSMVHPWIYQVHATLCSGMPSMPALFGGRSMPAVSGGPSTLATSGAPNTPAASGANAKVTEILPNEDEPSSVELAMFQDQQELFNGGYRRRRRREYRQTRAGIVPEPVACDMLGRPLNQARAAPENIAPKVLAEIATWNDQTFVQFQHLHCLNFQKSFQMNMWSSSRQSVRP